MWKTFLQLLKLNRLAALDIKLQKQIAKREKLKTQSIKLQLKYERLKAEC